jgi:hypothetical protein
VFVLFIVVWRFEFGIFAIFGLSVVFYLGFSVFGLFILVWHFEFGLLKLGF